MESDLVENLILFAPPPLKKVERRMSKFTVRPRKLTLNHIPTPFILSGKLRKPAIKFWTNKNLNRIRLRGKFKFDYATEDNAKFSSFVFANH